MFWLSHHHADELDRTWKIGGVHVCARCLGTYPILFAAIAAQLALRSPLEHPLDIPIALGFLLPALLDWAWGRFRPHAFSNTWRTLTGVLLGLALGRTLFIHLQRPLPLPLLLQMGLVTGVATPVILTTYRRFSRK
jgi:hypothetical protein